MYHVLIQHGEQALGGVGGLREMVAVKRRGGMRVCGKRSQASEEGGIGGLRVPVAIGRRDGMRVCGKRPRSSGGVEWGFAGNSRDRAEVWNGGFAERPWRLTVEDAPR